MKPAASDSATSIELAKLEKYRMISETKDVNRADFESRALMFKSVFDAGYLAMKSAIVINGSAAIAFLAFLGNIASRNIINNEMIIWGTEVLCIYGIGTFLAGVAIGLTYFAQRNYSEWENRKYGNYFSSAAIAAVTASYIAFAIAIYTIHSSVQIVFK